MTDEDWFIDKRQRFYSTAKYINDLFLVNTETGGDFKYQDLKWLKKFGWIPEECVEETINGQSKMLKLHWHESR